MAGHSRFKEMLLLYHYGELTNAERRRLESHLTTCDECRAELEQLTTMQRQFSLASQKAAQPELIERLNRRVMRQIQSRPRPAWFGRVRQLAEDILDELGHSLIRPRYQLISAGVIFLVGVLVGKIWLSTGLIHDPDMLLNFIGQQAALSRTDQAMFQRAVANYMLQSGNVEIAELVQSGGAENAGGLVQVNLKVEKSFALSGGLDDPMILNTLRYSALHDQDSPRRTRAVRLLTEAVPTPENENTLAAVARHDPLSLNRQEALEFLAKRPISESLLQTFMSIALRDSSRSLRESAIEYLGESGSAEVVPVLALVSAHDPDAELRLLAQKQLARFTQE